MMALFILICIPLGPSCNQCSFGYYGNATIGEATDCKECLCPGGLNAPNQFAKSCVMDQDRKPTCLSCETGYSGRQCQVCADGYYGNSMVLIYLSSIFLFKVKTHRTTYSLSFFFQNKNGPTK